MMKRLLKSSIVFVCFLISAVLFAFPGLAVSEDETSGSCGTGVEWSLDVKSGALTLSGSGKMDNYSRKEYTPWYSFSESITSVAVGEGITSIGNYAFAGLNGAKKIVIPSTVASIGQYAFEDTNSLQQFELSGENKSFMLFNSAIVNAAKTELYAFPAKSSVTVFPIPTTVKTVRSVAFKGAEKLSSVIIPASVTKIGENAFESAVSLKTVIFENSKPAVNQNAFANVTADCIITDMWITTSHPLDFYNHSGGEYQFGGVLTYKMATYVTVTFDTQGSDTIDTQKCISGGRIKKPNDLASQIEGIDFYGWYKESSCKNAWDFERDTVSKDTTVFAKWAQTVTVSFDSKGGSEIKSISLAKGDKIPRPDNPTIDKDSLRFDGWYKDSSCTSVWNFDKNTVQEDMTLFAKWSSLSPSAEYKIVEGANSSWKKGSEVGAIIVSSAPFTSFSSVEVDSKILSSANFEAYDKDGATAVVLAPEFTETLKEGNHTVNIISFDGNAITLLNIEASPISEPEPEPEPEPKKGPSAIVIILIIIAVLGIGYFVYVRFFAKKPKKVIKKAPPARPQIRRKR